MTYFHDILHLIRGQRRAKKREIMEKQKLLQAEMLLVEQQKLLLKEKQKLLHATQGDQNLNEGFEKNVETCTVVLRSDKM